MANKVCTHKDNIKDFPPHDITVCEDCIKIGDDWVYLRQCLSCGHVGCCDNSKNKHATKHFKKTHHPIIKSVSPEEVFTYCYIDDILLED
jgi:uncharacterized UBP type Zn finger protein